MPKQIYFIAIIPPENVAEEINAFRKLYLPDFNVKSEHKKFPHITLQHTFRKTPEIESELMPALNHLASGLPPFSISTSNIGHFDKRIIYIAIENNTALQNIYNSVRQLLLQQFQFTPDEISQTFTPHITLEKKLTPELFSLGWALLQNHTYHTTFNAQSFSLLKHNGIRWQPIANFYLAS